MPVPKWADPQDLQAWWANLTKWHKLNRFGKNRVLQSSYIWLFVVPMTVKALSAVEDPLVLVGLSEGLILHLTLPFSWKAFYASAVAVSVAGVIYELACPELIKKFSTFGEFQAEGRGFEYLHEYTERLDKQPRNEIKDPKGPPSADEVKQVWDNTRRPSMNVEPDPALAELYWRIQPSEDSKSPKLRTICFTFYCVGLGLIGWVLIENFLFVVRAWSG